MAILHIKLTQKPPVPVRHRPNGEPNLSDGALRLAAQLRANAKSGGTRVLMITPLSRSGSALRVAYEAAAALAQINESPVLLVDLESAPAHAYRGSVDAGPLPAVLQNAKTVTQRGARGELPPLTVIRPLAGIENPVAWVSSREFSTIMEDARKNFVQVIIAADSVAASVGSLLAANHADGVVLIVKESDTTTAMLRNARQALRRNHSKLLGFLYETK
jgi:Mrp family chromosome partitioning ATPase